jgi:hypothetical protein
MLFAWSSICKHHQFRVEVNYWLWNLEGFLSFFLTSTTSINPMPSIRGGKYLEVKFCSILRFQNLCSVLCKVEIWFYSWFSESLLRWLCCKFWWHNPLYTSDNLVVDDFIDHIWIILLRNQIIAQNDGFAWFCRFDKDTKFWSNFKNILAMMNIRTRQ